MALPILDGNQSATTLSTILSSGQHIPAHTVVSLGTQAITDMRGAVSGSVVSISNFPATQPVSIASVTIGNTVTIAGTVTANLAGTQTIAGTVTANAGANFSDEISEGILNFQDNEGGFAIGSLPAISGTVTASALKLQTGDNVFNYLSGEEIQEYSSGNPVVAVYASLPNALPTGTNRIGVVTIGGGTVTIGAGTAQIGSVTASISNSVTIGSALPAGTNRIGVVTIGNIQRDGDGVQTSLLTEVGSGYLLNRSYLAEGTAQIGSVTASISGTVPISISSVTVGNSVTIASLPAISGTVTANTFALQGTAVTTSNFTSTTASTLLAGYNATREVLTIFNEGAGNLHICAGATCTTIAYQVRLSAGDYYEAPNHQTTITHSAVFATAGTARVTEVS